MAVKHKFQHNDNSKEMTVEQFYAEAKKYHLFDSKPKKKDSEPSSLSVGDLDQIQEEPPFMITPLFREGEIIIIASEAKVGKTLFSIDLSLMAATGESIGNRLTSSVPFKTLYFDTEMQKIQFDNRVRKLSKNFTALSLIGENFYRECFRAHQNKINISKKNSQQFLESKIKETDAKLLVFDNLGGFLPYGAERSDSTWEAVSIWLKDLVSEGRTVLLVHHLNKTKEQRGTGKITDDADLVISLNKEPGPPAEKTRINFSITHARHLYGDNLVPFILEYLEEDKSIRRSVSPRDTGLKNHPQYHVTEADISAHDLSPLQIEILDNARALGEGEYLTAGMFKSTAKIKGRSQSTITIKFNDLLKKGLLTKRGTGSGTRYRLSQKENDTQKEK